MQIAIATAGCSVENYWRWKVTTAKLSQNQRAMIALNKSIIAALRSTLPKKISFDTLIEISRGIHKAEGFTDNSCRVYKCSRAKTTN